MSTMDLTLLAPRAVTPAGIVAVAVGVLDGRIAAVEPLGTVLPATRTIELGDDEVLLPGLVDTHVHVNEPGRTEWEGFATATRAAAAGGVTTIVDMPLNSMPADRRPGRAARSSARPRDGQCAVDVGFWGGAVPGNLGRPAARCTTPACSGSSASSRRRASTSSRRSTRASWPTRCARSRGSTGC